MSHDTNSDTSVDSHGSYKSYLTGFLFSVVLTVIPFWVVLGKPDIPTGLKIAVIFGMGAVQILVHVIYFLHVTVKAEQGWKLLSIVFTAVLLVIILAGSIWVMYHLNTNMMPGM